MKTHKLLSVFRPSSAQRQLTCTKSIIYDVDSKYIQSDIADKGIKLHEYAEQLLNDDIDSKNLNVKKDLDNDEITMLLKYAKYCNRLVHDFETDIFEVEREIDLSPVYNFTRDKFGTADAVIFNNAESTLHIVDLKTGMNEVSAYNNYQLYVYAYALLEDYKNNGIDDIEFVEFHIFQNLYMNYTNSFKISVCKLQIWINKNIRQPLTKIKVLDLQYVTGSHCTYCNNVDSCSAIFNEIDNLLEMAKNDDIDDSEKVAVITAEKAITSAISAYKSNLYDSLMLGADIDGIKLVKGNKRSYIAHDVMLEEYLVENGVSVMDIYNHKLKTPFQLKSTLKDLDKNLNIDDYIETKEASIILALASSNRKAVNLM